MATLSELLPAEAVRLDVPAADWREAVRAAGDLMTATGTSTGDYTTEMVENVEENGPYIVIAPGLAFAHARPSPAVLRTGMSWVRLESPVEFGHDSNDPVELVVGLAARESGEHTAAMAALAKLLGDPEAARALREAPTPEAVRTVLTGGDGRERAPAEPRQAATPAGSETTESETTESETAGSEPAAAASGAASSSAGSGGRSRRSGMHKILTVCGNGLGTSLFLKNTLEQVLDRWGWSKFITVEATDTVSARGKASESVAVLTSGEIARTLGDVGVPVHVVEDFTSTAEVDRTLRDTYDV